MSHVSALIRVGIVIGVVWLIGMIAAVGSIQAGCSGQYKCKPYNSDTQTCNQANLSWYVTACTGNTSSACMDSSSRDGKCCEEVGWF